MDSEQFSGLLQAMGQHHGTRPRHHGLEQRVMLESLFFLQQYEQHMRHVAADNPADLDQLTPLPMAHLFPALVQASPMPSGRRPLDEQTLRMLPRVVVNMRTLRRFQTTGSGDASCVICQEDYVLGQRLVQLPCSHTFCDDCGSEWLRRSNACPVCRRELEPLDPRARLSDFAWNSEDLFAFRRLPQGSPLAAARQARESREENQEAELWPPVEDMAQLAEQHSHQQDGSTLASSSRGGGVVTPPQLTVAASQLGPTPGFAVAEEMGHVMPNAASRFLRSSSAPVRPRSASLGPLRLPPVTAQAIVLPQPFREQENATLSC